MAVTPKQYVSEHTGKTIDEGVKKSLKDYSNAEIDTLLLNKVDSTAFETLQKEVKSKLGVSDTLPVYFGLCRTAKDIATKVITIENFPTTLKNGSILGVRFTHGSDSSVLTFKINGVVSGSSNSVKYFPPESVGIFVYVGGIWFSVDLDLYIHQKSTKQDLTYPILLGEPFSDESEVPDEVGKPQEVYLTPKVFINPSKGEVEATSFIGKFNGYVLGIADTSNPGLIKSGGDIEVNPDGTVNVSNNSHLHTVSNISDFPDWAKSSEKPEYTYTEVGADKSGASIEALNQSKAYTDSAIAALINGAPTTLDTLKEIADAMAESTDVIEALETSIGEKANRSELTTHTNNTSNPHSVTKAQVGLGNVDNTADSAKKVLQATNDDLGRKFSITYLPLAGGTMNNNANIKFTRSADDRYYNIGYQGVYYYAPTNYSGDWTAGITFHNNAGTALGRIGAQGNNGTFKHYFMGINASNPIFKLTTSGDVTIQGSINAKGGDLTGGTTGTSTIVGFMSFKNDDPSSNPTYPYTGFYQWGNEWQVNARDSSNKFIHNLLKLNNITGNAEFKGSVTASSFVGNASSATKLATPRTINGISFNGTSDIYLPSGRRWWVGSDNTSTSGWYKFMSVTMAQYKDFNMTLSITNEYGTAYSGIFYIHIRCDSTTTTEAPNKFGWLTRHGWGMASVVAVVNGLKVDLYINQTVGQWGGICFTVLSESSRRDGVAYTTVSSNLPADITPTVASTDLGIALAASRLTSSISVGSVTNPIYFSSGVPKACSYALEQDVLASSELTDYRVTQQAAHNHNSTYEVLLSSSSTTETERGMVHKSSKITANPSTGELTADKFIGVATSANKLNTNAGSSTVPVYFTNGVPTVCKYTLAAACARGVRTATVKTHSNYGTNDNYVPDMGFIAYWNGAYNSSGSSNLSYCNKGAFGSIVTKNSGEYLSISGGTMSTNSEVFFGREADNRRYKYGYQGIYYYAPTDNTNAWTAGMTFSDNAGTALGKIGTTGTTGTLNYYFMGADYSNPLFKLDTSGNATFTGAINASNIYYFNTNNNSNMAINTTAETTYASDYMTGNTIVGGLRNDITIYSSNIVILGGMDNTSNGTNCAIVAGTSNTARGSHSAIVAGESNTLSGSYSVISGGSSNNIASSYSFIGAGESNSIVGNYCAVFGLSNIGGGPQLVCGRYNSKVGNTKTSTTGAGLIIGNGTSSATGNCFYVDMSGNTVADGAYSSAGADYAEMFEWTDGNPNNEDRRGLFVTLEGDKMKIATSIDDFIIGVVSSDPSIVGDSHGNSWNSKFKRDVYGRIVTTEGVEEVLDPETGETIEVKVSVAVINPDYDPTKEYIPRSERPEWDPVGMLGKLVVKDDGTCTVNGFCVPNTDGTATNSYSKIGYRVMSRIDDTHILVLIK